MDAGPAPTAHYYDGSLFHFANLPLQWKCFQSFQKSSAFHNGLRDQRNADREEGHGQDISIRLHFHMKIAAQCLCRC